MSLLQRIKKIEDRVRPKQLQVFVVTSWTPEIEKSYRKDAVIIIKDIERVKKAYA